MGVRLIMRSVHVRPITAIACLTLLVTVACSQRSESPAATTEPLTSTAPPVGTTNALAPAPATESTASGATPTPSVATGTTATPTTDGTVVEESTTGASVAPTTTASAADTSVPPQETCVPAEPIDIHCADDLNTDEPQTPCSQWVEWGTCDESWMLERHVCDRSCGRCMGEEVIGTTPAVNTCEMATSSDAPPVMNEGPTLPPIDGGEMGFTTRYWDCCKPHCGWPQNASRPVSSCDQSNGNMGGNHDAQSACNGGNAYMCWNFGPRTNGDNIAYAFAAHNGVGCGTCFQFDFTGESHNPKPETGHDLGSQSLKGKSMIVQVINTGGIEAGQFDLLVPGGGVGEFNACSTQWGGAELGEQYGGFFLACQKEHNFRVRTRAAVRA